MKKLQTINIKLWLPVTTVAAFLIFTLSGIYSIHHSALERIEREARQDVRTILAETVFFVTYVAANAESAEIQRMVANMTLNEEVEKVVFIAANRLVHYASSFASIGRSADDVMTPDELSFLDSTSQSKQLQISRQNDHLFAVATLELPNAISHADYTIFIDYYIGDRLDQAFSEASRQTVPTLIFSLIIILFLLFFVQYFVSKPLLRINNLLQGIKNGMPDIESPLKGTGELAYVGEALSEAGKQIRQDIKNIKERENRLSVTLSSIGDGVIVCDNDGRIVTINPTAESLLGCDTQTALTKPVSDIFKARSLESQKILNPVYEVLATGEEVQLNNNTTLLTGKEPLQIAYSAAPIYQDNDIIGVILVFRDVSREYQLKAKLKQNVHFLENLIQISPSVTFVLKKDEQGDYGFSYISESINHYSTFNYQQWIDNTSHWKSFIHSEDISGLIKTCRLALVNQGQIKSTQFRFADKEGNYLTFKANLVALTELTKQGETVELVGVASDITEQVNAAKNNLLLGNILERSLNEIYIFDVESLHFLQVNYGARKNLGYTKQELQLLTPLDLKRDMTSAEFMSLVRPLKAGQTSSVEFETNHYRKDGTSYPVSVSLQLDTSNDRHCFVAVIRDITEKKKTESKINFLAFHDTLTKLPNRTLFDERLSQAISLAERNHQEFALLFVDLDRFKIINDTLGHDVGDNLLKVMAERMSQVVRDIDTVSRSGGDEFSLILLQTDSSGAAHVADKLLDVISKPVIIDNNSLYVTGSIGISLFPGNGRRASELMKRADNAMYRAKETRPNSYHFYTETMHINMQHRMQLERQLREAIKKEQFCMVYQPQVELETNTIIAAEALIRWDHCSVGRISPAEFIPLAEESGLINDIGDWVLQEVIAQVAEWQKVCEQHFVTSINVSASQFRDERLLDKISFLLKENDVSPAAIEIEITESTAMENIERSVQQMQKLSNAGIGLSMDDFGTGFSSLNSLKKFPFKKLKIDKSFIDDILKDNDDQAIIDAIITLAQKLKLTTVAEGVESELQRQFLTERGCDAIQGYVFSKPVSADALLSLIMASNAEA